MIVLVMGVSGSGKTTIGRLLAERTGAIFADADDFHSAANKAKMAAGQALTDEDRQPWLGTLNRLLRTWAAQNSSGLLACSALKQHYRNTLADQVPPQLLHVIFLQGPKQLIAERLAHRHHEYMNPALLESQFTTLEAPQDALCIVNDRTPAEVVDEIITRLDASSTKVDLTP